MQYQVKVKPDNGQRAGWEIDYFTWDEPTQTQGPEHRVVFGNANNGVFSGTINLEAGLYGFGCTVVGTGRKIDVDLTPAARILLGADPEVEEPEWPQTCESPSLQQQDLLTIYFEVGAGQ